MKIPFEKIYVISLLSNKPRHEQLRKQFEYLGLDFEFIWGVDFANLRHVFNGVKIQYPKLYDKQLNFRVIKDFSASIAHYMAVQQAYEFEYNNILILEDDIHFLKDINVLSEYFNSIPKDADLITWDPRFIEEYEKDTFIPHIDITQKYTDLSKTENNMMIGSMCYAIMNRKAMWRYIANQRLIFSISDQVKDFFTQSTDIRRYSCNRCLCTDEYNLSRNFNVSITAYKNIFNEIEKLSADLFI